MPPQFQNSLFQSKLVLPMLFIISIHRAESTNSFACDPANVPTQNLPFCDMSLPIQERVNDLISRLNFAEKISLLGNNAAPVPRLGINSYKWWSEALHGVSYVGGGVQFGGDFPAATSFPQVILTAASFNFCLWEEIGRVVSDEARAMYNGGHAGLTYWSPTINILRDPRWGRAQETTGEDPYLAGEYARSYVKGLQGSDSSNNGPLKVAACCKHFTAYDLDNWNHTDRFHFDARVTQQDLDDTYNVPFEKCVVDGNVACVMCSYNKVNGKPTCADPNLLKNTVRGQWNLNGYIVSDCDSVEVLFKHHKYTRTPEEAVAKSMKAGLDLNCGKYLQKYVGHAIWMRMMKEDDVDVAINNTLKVQMRLGMYDGKPSKQPYGMLGPNDVCKPYHQQLAVEAARQGIVLLQNNKSSLPLSKHKHKEIAVIGPNADVTVTMIGNYFGIPCNYVTPLQGIRAYANTKYQKACKDVACNDNGGFAAAVLAAQKADAAVLVMGLDQSMEREGLDRPTLLLPENQRDLISRVAKVSKGPVILVLMSGGPIDVSFAKDDPRIGAILWAGYPGQAGGTAIADVVFGTDIPGGNLPMTWYPESYLAMAPMTDMRMRADDAGYPGRTYRFYEGRVVFPFGHGLSYSTFQKRLVQAPTKFCIPYASSLYTSKNSTKLGDFVRVSHAHCSKLSLSLHVEVRNTGTVDGSHTVLMFAEPPAAMGRSTPRKQLISFEKVHLVAGSQKQVKMGIDVCKHLSLVDQFGVRKIPMGEHTLHIGNLKHSINLQATS